MQPCGGFCVNLSFDQVFSVTAQHDRIELLAGG